MMMSDGTRKKARTAKTGSDSLAALTSTPSSKEAVASAVASWQERWDDAFHDEVKALIARHYPSDSKTLFDDVLAAFLFAEPEYCSSLLAPLIDALLSKRLSFSLRNAPFHSLQVAFAEAQAPGRGRTGRVFCNEILSLLAPHAQAAGPCAWLTDSLVDATPTLRESFFVSYLLGTQPGRLRSLVAILEEERRRFRSANLSHAMAPALLARLDKERNSSAVLEEHLAFLQLYFSPQQASAQHTFQTHKLVYSLLSTTTTTSSNDEKPPNGMHPTNGVAATPQPPSPSSSPAFLPWLVSFLSTALPPPSSWFAVHFLPPILQGIHNGLPASLDFLCTVIGHPLHSAYLLGPPGIRTASLQAGRVADRTNQISALLSSCTSTGPSVAAKVLQVWQSTWETNAAWADDWERLSALLHLYPSLSAELRAAIVCLFAAFLDCTQRPNAQGTSDLTRKIMWTLLAEAKPGMDDLYATLISHAAAISAEARAKLEMDAAGCMAAIAVFELPSSVSFVVTLPSASPGACKHSLVQLCRLLDNVALKPVVVSIALQAAPSLFGVLRARDPETRHAAVQFLSALFAASSPPPGAKNSPFFHPPHVNLMLAALQDEFAFVADTALTLVQRLTVYEAFAYAALTQSWALLMSGSDSSLILRLIGVLDSLVSLWHSSVLSELLRRIDAQLFAAHPSIPRTVASICTTSRPNTHLLLLLERLCRYDAVRTSAETKAVISRAVRGVGLYPEDVTIHQLKLLAACSNPTVQRARDDDMLISARPALVRSLTSSNATLRDLALLLLCWDIDSTPEAYRVSDSALLCTHIQALAQHSSPHDASLLLAALTALQSRPAASH